MASEMVQLLLKVTALKPLNMTNCCWFYMTNISRLSGKHFQFCRSFIVRPIFHHLKLKNKFLLANQREEEN